MANFDQAIVKTLKHEGGDTFTNDATDHGGATKFGISQNAYPDVDIQNLTETQAKDIYRRDYWNRIRGDDIHSQRVAENIFDACVNMGVHGGSKLAQTSLSIEPADGIIGSQSLKTINAADEELFLAKFALAKLQRYADLCKADNRQKKYLLGWLNRTLENTA